MLHCLRSFKSFDELTFISIYNWFTRRSDLCQADSTVKYGTTDYVAAATTEQLLSY